MHVVGVSGEVAASFKRMIIFFNILIIIIQGTFQEAPKHGGENDIVIIAGRQDVISLSLSTPPPLSLSLTCSISLSH